MLTRRICSAFVGHACPGTEAILSSARCPDCDRRGRAQGRRPLHHPSWVVHRRDALRDGQSRRARRTHAREAFVNSLRPRSIYERDGLFSFGYARCQEAAARKNARNDSYRLVGRPRQRYWRRRGSQSSDHIDQRTELARSPQPSVSTDRDGAPVWNHRTSTQSEKHKRFARTVTGLAR